MDNLSPAWQSCLDHFLRQVSRCKSPATVAAYRGVISRFFAHVRKSPEMVSRQDVESFIYSRSDKPWTRDPSGMPATATVNVRLAVLSSFYRYSATYTIAGPDGQPTPLMQRASPTLGMRPGKPLLVHKSLSFEEVKKFFGAIDDTSLIGKRDTAVFAFFLFSLRRRAEVQRLRWGDIEATTLIDADGTRRHVMTYRFRGKGRVSQDTMELPEPVWNCIRAYLVSAGRWGKMSPDEPLFLAIGPELGGNVHSGEIRALSEAGMVRRMEHYCKLAGITKQVSLHSWRHTGARERYAAGQDILSLQKSLQHQGLNTTYIYLSSLSGAADPGATLLAQRFASLSL